MKVWGNVSIRRMGTLVMLAAALAACEGPKAHRVITELSPIHYNYIYLFANYELLLDIGADGTITARQQTGNTAADVTRATGQLTPDQKGELLQAFTGWEDLLPNYPADVTPLYQITFGDHRVVAGNNPAVPPKFKQAQAALDRVARSILAPHRATTAPRQP